MLRFRSPLEDPQELGKLWPRVQTIPPEPGRREPESVVTRFPEERLVRGWSPGEIRPTEPVTLPKLAFATDIDLLLEASYGAALVAHQQAMQYADALMRDYTAAAAKSEITGGEFRQFKGGITDFTTKTNTALSNAQKAITSLNKLRRLVREIKVKRGVTGTERRGLQVRIPVRV